MAGDLVRAAACAGGGELVPVDSEHSAVLQCLHGRETGLARVILTASGGPFREMGAGPDPAATVQEALNHPTWSMGNKVTVDSATLANKALELIEAHHFFELGYDTLDVVVHPRASCTLWLSTVTGASLPKSLFPRWNCRFSMPSPIPPAPGSGCPPVRSGEAGVLTFEPVRAMCSARIRRGFRRDAPADCSCGVQCCQRNRGGCIPRRTSAVRPHLRYDRAVLDEHEPAPAGDLDTVRAADQWSRVRASGC